jgi:hypothetical protein
VRLAPGRVIPEIAHEVSRRLRVLARRQAEPELERKRIGAFIAIGFALLVFMWIFMTP